MYNDVMASPFNEHVIGSTCHMLLTFCFAYNLNLNIANAEMTSTNSILLLQLFILYCVFIYLSNFIIFVISYFIATIDNFVLVTNGALFYSLPVRFSSVFFSQVLVS